MKNIQVLLLAAGVGRRMWPIKTNKNLLTFFGQPLVVHQVETLRQAGFSDLTVVVNPEIKTSMEKLALKTKIAVQAKPLGQGDAILAAARMIDKNKPLLVVNANDFFRLSLLRELKQRFNDQLDALLVAQRTKQYFPGGYLLVSAGRVKAMVEKPEPGQEPSDLVKLVLDFFREPAVLMDYISKVKKTNISYESALDAMMKAGRNFGLVEYAGPWVTIKQPDHILDTTEFFLKERQKPAVVKAEGVKIFRGAIVKNSYLGSGVVIGNHALVRDSIIEAGSVIGYSAEIARSYIGPNCWFHANYVGDSVLEGNNSFGSGARTANLRLDEKEIVPGRIKLGAIVGVNSRVGINASLMPGVKIGSNAFVGPGLILKDDLADNQFSYLQQAIVQKKNQARFNLNNREEFRKKL